MDGFDGQRLSPDEGDIGINASQRPHGTGSSTSITTEVGHTALNQIFLILCGAISYGELRAIALAIPRQQSVLPRQGLRDYRETLKKREKLVETTEHWRLSWTAVALK